MRRRVVVRGVVQRVGFRWSCAEQAGRLGVAGWVCNRADGCVEAVVEGAPEQVDAMLAHLRRGPRGAHVTAVDVREEPVEGLSAFEVEP